MDKRQYHDFVEIFSSQSTEKIRREPLCVSEKFPVSKNLLNKKGKGGSLFSVVLIKLKNVGKGWDSNTYLPLQNRVILPTVPWENGILEKCQ